MDETRFKIDKLSEVGRLLVAKTSSDHDERWLPLWMHLMDTAGIMEQLLRHWLPQSAVQKALTGISEPQLQSICIFLGYVHDLGKASVVFQSRILLQLPLIQERQVNAGLHVPLNRILPESGKTPHALAGEAILVEMGCPLGVAAVVSAHHGKPRAGGIDLGMQLSPRGYAINYFGEDDPSRWRTIWSELIEQALTLSDLNKLSDLPELSISGQMLLTGLLIMADWIASNPCYFPLIDCAENGSDALYPDRIDSAWEKLSLPLPWQPGIFDMDETMFQDRFSFAPNAMQKAVLATLEQIDQPGLMILEAQMGGGKTEAALAVAEVLAGRCKTGGLFFGLPTQATANGIFERLECWAEEQSADAVHGIRLAHGMAELNDDYKALFSGTASQAQDEGEGVTIHPWFQGRKQALLSDFVIGTVDQLLMAALKQRHVMLRHLGLAGKVVIIDECHAYDAYMNEYLERALTWMGSYGAPVILLSATLPAEKRARLIDAYLNKTKQGDEDWRCSHSYPLLTWTDGNMVHQQALPRQNYDTAVELCCISEEHVISQLHTVSDQGGCAGFIVNTVRRAQDWATRLQKELPETEIVVAHAQFLMPDRAEQERMLVKRLGKRSTPDARNRLIVVGTQVLEQSLDIDFDLLVTDLCPMDLLLQRIGRLHRHQRQRPTGLECARCLILGAQEELEPGASAVYGDWLLLRTRDMLPKRLTIPQDISKLVQSVYDFDGIPSPDDPLHNKAKENALLKIKKQIQGADCFRLAAPSTFRRTKLNQITGKLDTDVAVDDIKAQAAVRDGGQTIEVLVFCKHADGTITYLPWQNGGATIWGDRIPTQEERGGLQRQRIRLPARLCADFRIDRVIAALEEIKRQWFSEWQFDPVLESELVLLLDETLHAELDGEQLQYSKKFGLQCDKKEEKNGGKRV